MNWWVKINGNGFAGDVVIFGVNNNFIKLIIQKNNFLVLGERSPDGANYSTGTIVTKIVWSLVKQKQNYNGDESYLYVNKTETLRQMITYVGITFVEEARHKILQKINKVKFLEMVVYMIFPVDHNSV